MFTHTNKHLTLLTKSKRSQSALEYMMTYGWAILIIVIVAVILYSMGIFNPSSSVTFTSSGFSPFAVSSVICNPSGLLVTLIGGGLPNTATSATISKIYITSNTGTTALTKEYNLTPIKIYPGTTATIIIPTITCTSANTKYSLSANLQYSYSTPAGNVITNTTGTITGASSSNLVASFNGVNSYMSTPENSILNNTENFSVALWFKTSSYGAMIWLGSGPMPNYVGGWWNILYVGSNNSLFGGTDCGPIFQTNKIVSNNAWTFAVLTQNVTAAGKTEVLYLNGSEINKISDSVCTFSPYYFVVGAGSSNGANWPDLPPISYFNGSISNVQLYNLAITANNVSKLFLNGRNSLPLQNLDLIAWWPLDGNTLDYSGNGRNGVSNNIKWVIP
ncbi:MAG: LamG-like jellyroll fold domain-containing protein [Candidatus Parvarchaeum sp.]